LWLGPIVAQAQTNFYFGISNSINKTSLLNKDDQKAGSELNLTSTFKYAGGIEVGYRFDRLSGFTGISAQLLYAQMGQQYDGQRAVNDYPTLKGETKLDYLKLPVDFRFSVNTSSNIRPYATAGLYVAYLLHYKESYHVSGSSGSETETIEDKSYSSDVFSGGVTTYHGTLNKGIYKKIDVGGRIGIGAEYIASDRWSIDARFSFDYGFINPENRKSISLKFDPDFISANPNAELSYWSGSPSKYSYDAAYTKERAATHNMSLGISLTVNYYFKP